MLYPRVFSKFVDARKQARTGSHILKVQGLFAAFSCGWSVLALQVQTSA